MWVGTQTSQVEIKLSLKACQVRPCVLNSGAFIAPRVSLPFLVGSDRVPHPRSTSNTCAPRTPRGPASCAWCGKATSPGPSPAASTPGVSSANPQHSAPLTPALNRWIRFSLSRGEWGALGCPCPPFSRGPFPSSGAHGAVQGPASVLLREIAAPKQQQAPCSWGAGGGCFATEHWGEGARGSHPFFFMVLER